MPQKIQAQKNSEELPTISVHRRCGSFSANSSSTSTTSTFITTKDEHGVPKTFQGSPVSPHTADSTYVDSAALSTKHSTQRNWSDPALALRGGHGGFKQPTCQNTTRQPTRPAPPSQPLHPQNDEGAPHRRSLSKRSECSGTEYYHQQSLSSRTSSMCSAGPVLSIDGVRVYSRGRYRFNPYGGSVLVDNAEDRLKILLEDTLRSELEGTDASLQVFHLMNLTKAADPNLYDTAVTPCKKFHQFLEEAQLTVFQYSEGDVHDLHASQARCMPLFSDKPSFCHYISSNELRVSMSSMAATKRRDTQLCQDYTRFLLEIATHKEKFTTHRGKNFDFLNTLELSTIVSTKRLQDIAAYFCAEKRKQQAKRSKRKAKRLAQ